MKLKGRSHANGAALAYYLENPKHDARVLLSKIYGSKKESLSDAFVEWEKEAAGTRCKKSLWHAVISPNGGEEFSLVWCTEAVHDAEYMLGLEEMPHAIVIHQKGDESEHHVHVVWLRIDRETRKVRHPRSYRTDPILMASRLERRKM